MSLNTREPFLRAWLSCKPRQAALASASCASTCKHFLRLSCHALQALSTALRIKCFVRTGPKDRIVAYCSRLTQYDIH